jgi:hypothetical protein
MTTVKFKYEDIVDFASTPHLTVKAEEKK